MELTRARTLAATIAEGERLLATTRAGTRAVAVVPDEPAPAAVAVIPHQPGAHDRVLPPVVDDPPEGDWHTVDDLALGIGWDPWTVDEHLHNGTLHGHDDSGEWLVRRHVADAFLRGRDQLEQRRACGCRALRLVHGTRADARASDGWLALL